MKIRDFKRGFLIFLIILFSVFLISCGTGDDGDEGGDDGTGGETAQGASLSIATSQATVQSDNIDSADITATVLDKNGAVVGDVLVTFSTSAGFLNASSRITDSNGVASVTFTSGTDNNQTATITASASGVSPASIPIQIVGSKLTLAVTENSIPDDGSETAELTITATNAADVPQSGVPITLAAAGTGVVTLSETDGLTSLTGVFTVTVTGTSAGTVTVTAQGAGDTKSVDFTVNLSGQIVFGIDAVQEGAGPLDSSFEDPYPLSTNTDLRIVVNAPDPPGPAQVLFATTVGGWDGGASKVVFKGIVAGQAEAVLRSADAGSATVEVYYAGSQLPRDSMTVAISRPALDADSVVLQASADVVQPSIGSETNTVTLTATVTSGGQPVGGAAVAFSIVNPLGGGESISPVVAISESTGEAITTFESGTLSTDQNGITIRATVVGTAIEDEIAIEIGGTALSLAIGYGTVIQSNESNTLYLLPMSVLVADANGNPVSGATVSLGLWPTAYRTGAWYETRVGEQTVWRVYTSGIFPNEDVDKDGYRDDGEDINLDNQLTPPNSAGGTVPATVITDDNGTANFELEFLKTSAVWVTDRIRATTMVLETETTSYLEFGLPFEKLEGEGHLLGDSPWPYLLVAPAGGTTAPVLFPSIVDPDFDTYEAIFGDIDTLDNTYTYDGTGTVAGDIASDEVTVHYYGYPTVTFPVRIVFE
ncbi:MAG: Ig-like domain-containing protein [Deltaproteobacteria bacterium]|nr:Ig-like domain-containing protein [Deltaproteobacteria bacterium]MBN2846146.1 Ig-like domain-containing protein [Deltaproteobacteria bacterium]